MQSVIAWPLEENETIIWQGRPAPRCYVFRHWLQALVGTILFLAGSFWFMVGVHLVHDENHPIWLLVFPLAIVLGAFLVGPGQVIYLRIRWGKVFYALTDQRLLVRSRLFGTTIDSYPMENFQKYRTKQYGKHLRSLKLSFQGCRPVVLDCLEHPETFMDFLPDTFSGDKPSI